MTEKTINAAQADVNAMRALKALEDRLRHTEIVDVCEVLTYDRSGDRLAVTRVEYVPCGFCARPVKLTAYACECGWKLSA
jgi:hypothetical protein